MLRRFIFAVGFAVSIALSAGAAMGQGKSAESLAVEASTLYQAASGMADPRERGRLFYIIRLRIEEIKKSFPQSVIAAQLSFGRYQSIDVAVVTREAQAWAILYPAEAASLQGGATAAAGGLVPSFGSSGGTTTGGQPPATAVVAPTGDIVTLLPGPPKRLPQTEVVRRLREAVVIIYVPNPAAGTEGSGTGFFISPQHLMTNTHVVEGVDRVVVSNKTIGVKSAHVLYRGMSKVQDGNRSREIGIDTAILETDGWTHTAYLPFAESVEEGESITIGGYPGRASGGDKAYDLFFSLIRRNSLPTPETIPNVKFDFGYVQSIFVSAETGIENLQNGVNTSGGNSGSPLVNRCGAVVAQHFSGTQAVLDIGTETRNGKDVPVAYGDTAKFNYAVSGKEVVKFLRSAHIPFSVASGQCPPAASD